MFNLKKRRPDEEWLRSHTMQLADLTLGRDADEYNFAFYGTAKSGKTTLLRMLQRSLTTAIPDETKCVQYYLFDPKNEFYDEHKGQDLPLKTILVNMMDIRSWAWDHARD